MGAMRQRTCSRGVTLCNRRLAAYPTLRILTFNPVSAGIAPTRTSYAPVRRNTATYNSHLPREIEIPEPGAFFICAPCFPGIIILDIFLYFQVRSRNAGSVPNCTVMQQRASGDTGNAFLDRIPDGFRLLARCLHLA